MHRTSLAILVLLLVMISACQTQPTEVPPAASEPATAMPEPTVEPTVEPTEEVVGPGVNEITIGNMTYTLPDGMSYELANGVFWEQAAPGSATFNLVSVGRLPAAFGDLNGDGVPDASVIVVNDPGGSGTFRYLAAVVDEDGWPLNIDTVLLGDRTQILSNQVVAGAIVLEVVTHGPDDPMCCPTEHRTWTYQLQEGKLVRTGDELLAPVPTEEAVVLPGPYLTLTPDPRKATTGEKVDFYTHATANEAGVVKLEFYKDGELLDEWTSDTEEGEPFIHHTFVWRQAEKGAFDFQVKAIDAAGGEGWSPIERVTVKDPAERTAEAEVVQPHQP